MIPQIPQHAIIQNAWYVPDLDAAIARWHRSFGLGPFFVRRHIVLGEVRYRGAPATLDISAAYVQCGTIMVELVTQHGDARSAFRDMYAAHEGGLHHVAILPDDYDATLREYAAQGFPVATELVTASGRGAAYVDTRPAFGCMVEVYPQSEGLRQLYRDVAAAAAAWDRRRLTIEVGAAS